MRVVGQVLVLTSQANHKVNLKNGRTYLQ
jgi:hypothetical protein